MARRCLMIPDTGHPNARAVRGFPSRLPFALQAAARGARGLRKTLPVGLRLSESMDRRVRTHVLQWRQSRKRREAHAWHCKARISFLATRTNRRVFPMRHAHPGGRVRAGCRMSPPCPMRRARSKGWVRPGGRVRPTHPTRRARLGCQVRLASSKRRRCWMHCLLPRLSPWAIIWPTLS